MAINLVGKLMLRDNMSGPLRKIENQMKDTERASSRMADKVKQNGREMGRFGKFIGGAGNMLGGFGKGVIGAVGGLGRLLSKLNPVALGLSAIATAATAAYTGVKIFNATVGEAMKLQQSEVTIRAMFDDKKASKQYMKMIDDMAIKSPILDSAQMYSNSKSFIAVSKNVKELEKMWSLAERLAASDPAQGVEGAVFALRELFSGDAVSMVERFEMPRQIMNEIKKLPLEQQLSRLDQYFEKIGLSQKLIDEMGSTALGKWTQVKERWSLLLRDMGEPSIKVVSDFLSKMLDRLEGQEMQKFAIWGGNVIQQMLNGLSNNAVKIYDYFTNLSKDPEFQARTTLTGKISFILEDIADKLNAWFEGGGKDKVISFGSKAAQVLVGALDASGAAASIGAKVGKSLWSGVISGVKQSAKESPVGQFLTGAGYALKYTNPIVGPGKAMRDLSNKVFGKKSHAGGLDRVPYDGYEAILHKDEKVLTAAQAKEYRNGSAKSVNITGNTFVLQGSTKEQAQEFLRIITDLLESEGVQMT